MSYTNNRNAKEAWLRRLQVYWNSPTSPHFITRLGEIYEVDFGINPGTEFSGRHLALCLRDSVPSQEKMLVIPLTTKFKEYNIAEEDIIETEATNTNKIIKGGIVLGEAKWVSKFRVFRCSKILAENPDTSKIIKGSIKVPKENLKRWLAL